MFILSSLSISLKQLEVSYFGGGLALALLLVQTMEIFWERPTMEVNKYMKTNNTLSGYFNGDLFQHAQLL
jgi:hypothetical protein